MEDHPIFKKTRIAPTPSGFLHLGNVLSFAITAALTKKTKAKMVLRIDDVDQLRTNKLYVQDIFDTLDFLEIPWDEGPKNYQEYEDVYSQRHRMGLYAEALEQLKENGTVFACTCSRSQVLEHNRGVYPGACRDKNIPYNAKNTSWRIDTSGSKKLSMNTLQGVTTTDLPENMHDFIVRKKDGFPAYQLTSVVDDIYFGIDLVVRGEDLRPSSLAQLYLASLLEKNAFPETTFYHHPLLLEPDGEKLSKSAGATSIQYLRMQHKKPSEIYMMIANMMGVPSLVKDWESLYQAIGQNSR